MAKFPYDEQQCAVHMGSLFPGHVDVDSSLGVDLQFFQQSNEFDLIATKTQEFVTQVGLKCYHASINI